MPGSKTVSISCGLIRPALISSTQWHATRCSSPSFRSGGTSVLQRVGCTYGQRVWKRQAGGGFAGLGMSPASRIVSRSAYTAGSGIGTAESSEIVYGWSGFS
jgi:hypothetical protein